ncbi:MAG TPA: cyclic nucleotide-binding domain-containing protein [Thermoleophilaceae bacterium]
MDEAKLRDIPLFAKLSRKQRKMLALRADEVEVSPGKLVCRKGESAHELYVIEQGSAKVVRDDQYLDELGPGDFFGEMGLLEDAPRNANVIATTPMTLMILSAPAFRQLEREQPQLAARISRTIEQRRHWLEPAL